MSFNSKELQHKIDNKTKPPGSLGRLEEIALKVGAIQESLNPKINQPHILVFAGDHGIAASGLVNPYPQAVTAQMVLNFIRGGAAINVFCRQHHIQLCVVDAGVNADFENISSGQFIPAKIGYGTKNYMDEPAMSEQEVKSALEKGKEIISLIYAKGCNCVGFGEMGIGNTSAAALIMSVITRFPIEQCVGKGTGVNSEQMEIKIKTLQKVYEKHIAAITHNNSAIELLRTFGGFEIAMMAGAYIEASKRKMVIVVDGFIGTSALMIANKITPGVIDHCIFAHTSEEKGHEKMLHNLDAKPLLNLQMRLGEGTGAALAIPLIQSAVNFVEEMASFETAGVTNKE
ncbi:MAG: nicotinate-nucleotide--dimethylbenzimidazole phosphoribosyltransferase [Bacteroidetes bacterium]|nr:nicotinate-nucleotide--dimethylbenzimidazole phosphoribosyltransferase [Bacteroidota bacterium]